MSEVKRFVPDDAEQSRMFIQKAKEIDADEKRSAADDLLGRLARTPPNPKAKGKQPARLNVILQRREIL